MLPSPRSYETGSSIIVSVSWSQFLLNAYAYRNGFIADHTCLASVHEFTLHAFSSSSRSGQVFIEIKPPWESSATTQQYCASYTSLCACVVASIFSMRSYCSSEKCCFWMVGRESRNNWILGSSCSSNGYSIIGRLLSATDRSIFQDNISPVLKDQVCCECNTAQPSSVVLLLPLLFVTLWRTSHRMRAFV